jgi:hypothetical protein
MHRLKISAALFAVALLAATSQPALAAGNQCFLSRDFESWKSPDPHTIYIRVNFKRYYRLDLANRCSTLNLPNTHLITHIHGPDMICSAIDWDLKVSQGGVFSEPCIVKTMTLLTPEEVAAIPKKFKP